MLASLRLRSVRNALVIMLMILSALVAGQRVQAVIDGIQHGLAIDHAATALELASGDFEHGYEHAHERADDHGGGAADDDGGPAPHHHHSEGPQIAALTSAPVVEIAVSRADAGFTLADTGAPLSRIFDLERPPKALDAQA